MRRLLSGRGIFGGSTHDRLIGGAGIEGVSGGVFGRAVLKEALVTTWRRTNGEEKEEVGTWKVGKG